MASIKQNAAASPLPDFRNTGVILRCLLGVNLLTLIAALIQSDLVAQTLQRYLDLALWVQPLLLFNLALLALIGRMLARIPLWLARMLIVLQAGSSAAMLHDFWRLMNFVDGGGQRLLRAGLLGALVAGALLIYFAWRAHALSPALVEARLQALTARIRPHFLFNSLNAVLSLIRSDPERAENALEELAELFRALMRDHRELITLADELALCRQYLDLEKLRLAERLHVDWQLGEWPADLKVPPLLVQPLLENAIYHGIEPAAVSGTITIRLACRGEQLHLELTNPCHGGNSMGRGNRMALDNIRERLALHYDLEARLEAGETPLADGQSQYRVHIVLPCRDT